MELAAVGFFYAERFVGVRRCTNSDLQFAAPLAHSPCSSKTKLFYIKFSDLHVSKEHSIKPRRLISKLFRPVTVFVIRLFCASPENQAALLPPSTAILAPVMNEA